MNSTKYFRDRQSYTLVHIYTCTYIQIKNNEKLDVKNEGHRNNLQMMKCLKAKILGTKYKTVLKEFDIAF